MALTAAQLATATAKGEEILKIAQLGADVIGVAADVATSIDKIDAMATGVADVQTKVSGGLYLPGDLEQVIRDTSARVLDIEGTTGGTVVPALRDILIRCMALIEDARPLMGDYLESQAAIDEFHRLQANLDIWGKGPICFKRSRVSIDTPYLGQAEQWCYTPVLNPDFFTLTNNSGGVFTWLQVMGAVISTMEVYPHNPIE